VRRRPVICHVVHSLNFGGAELLAAGIAEHLRPHFQSIFACLDEDGALAAELRSAGTIVHHLRRQKGFDLACARRLRGWLREQQVDLIHAHQTLDHQPVSWRARPHRGRRQCRPRCTGAD
jgi:hypothetical protein